MKNLIVTVNGVAYNVTVEEGTGAPAPAAAPAAPAAPAPAAAPAAPAPAAAPLRRPPPLALPVRSPSTPPCPATSWMSR